MSIETNPWAGQGHYSRYIHYNNSGKGDQQPGRYSTNPQHSTSHRLNQNFRVFQQTQSAQVNSSKHRLQTKLNNSIKHSFQPTEANNAKNIKPVISSQNTELTPAQKQCLILEKIRELEAAKQPRVEPKQLPIPASVITPKPIPTLGCRKIEILTPPDGFSPSFKLLCMENVSKIEAFAQTLDLSKGPIICELQGANSTLSIKFRVTQT